MTGDCGRHNVRRFRQLISIVTSISLRIGLPVSELHEIVFVQRRTGRGPDRQ